MDGTNFMRELPQPELHNTAEAYWDRGDDARQRRLYAEAQAIFAEGIEKFPESANLWNGLARAFRADHNKDREALLCFTRAHNLAPNNTKIHLDLADFLSKREHYEEAEHQYARVYAREGENGYLLFGLGNHYQRATRYSFASACFWQASVLQPNFVNSLNRYDELVARFKAKFYPNVLEDVRARMAQAALKPLAPYAR